MILKCSRKLNNILDIRVPAFSFCPSALKLSFEFKHYLLKSLETLESNGFKNKSVNVVSVLKS